MIERNREERASVAIDYERADYVRASKEIARMTKFKDKVADNVAAANKARSALEWAESYLTSAKTELTNYWDQPPAQIEQLPPASSMVLSKALIQE